MYFKISVTPPHVSRRLHLRCIRIVAALRLLVVLAHHGVIVILVVGDEDCKQAADVIGAVGVGRADGHCTW